jgi:hypothetical protein
LAAYGPPQIRIPPMEVGLDGYARGSVPENSDQMSYAAFLWSDQPPGMTREILKFLLGDIPNPGDIGFTAPVLRLVYRVQRGLVRGMSVHLFDPSRFKERSEDAAASDARENERRAKDAGAQIKLR